MLWDNNLLAGFYKSNARGVFLSAGHQFFFLMDQRGGKKGVWRVWPESRAC